MGPEVCTPVPLPSSAPTQETMNLPSPVAVTDMLSQSKTSTLETPAPSAVVIETSPDRGLPLLSKTRNLMALLLLMPSAQTATKRPVPSSSASITGGPTHVAAGSVVRLIVAPLTSVKPGVPGVAVVSKSANTGYSVPAFVAPLST